MKFLKEIDYNNIDKGIEYLQKNKFNYYPKNNEIIYHVYWYGNMTRKQILCINSYLATQNLEKTKLWIWLDYENGYNKRNIDYINSKIIKNKGIEIKKYIPNVESKETLFSQLKHINHNKFLKFRSDLARLIILFKYGGIYYDLDLILLKDLMPLLGIEFCYTWSFMKKGNNGILRLKKNGELITKIMKKYIKILKNKEFYLGFNQLIFTKDIDIMCFPCVMFDPVWILHDLKQKSKYSSLNNFDNFFKKTKEDVENKFFHNQIFTYHWHSRNNYKIEKKSFFERLENRFNV